MTLTSVLRKGRTALKNGGVENYKNEASWIFESVFGRSAPFSDYEAPAAETAEYFRKIESRLSGIPVQYALGSWDFYAGTFETGFGVFIPRPETETLADFALDYLSDKEAPVVFDLCAGGGCVGITVARLVPGARVFLLEKSPEAFKYLEKNLAAAGDIRARAVMGDVFDGFEAFDLPEPELILSNPPYIKTGDIPKLQREVLFEPREALDGGEDGLDFYRVISEKWLDFVSGAVAVECDGGETDYIESLFSRRFKKTRSLEDLFGVKRVVVGEERKKYDN